VKRWDAFKRFREDEQMCLTNNAAERGLRGVALGRKAWRFAESNRGGKRATAKYSLVVTAKLDDVDPARCIPDARLFARLRRTSGSHAQPFGIVERPRLQSSGQPSPQYLNFPAVVFSADFLWNVAER
jgi:Transposase IS66 family